MSPFKLVCAIDTNTEEGHPAEGCSEPLIETIATFKTLNEAQGKENAALADYNKKNRGARATACSLIKGDVVEKEILADWRLEK